MEFFRTYLQSGRLRISERSFGETSAARDVSDDLFDVRNSVYSIGAMRERRVEIVEVKAGGVIHTKTALPGMWKAPFYE
jgi:hypothetical protein